MSWSKYIVQKKQEYSGGTWVDVVPSETRQGRKIGEYSTYEECISGSDTRWVNIDINEDYWCDECPTPTFDGKFKATYEGGTTYSAECDSNETLTTADTKPSGYQYSAMTEAVIGDCVTSIGANAFLNCSSLTSINIPNGVTSIGNNAFFQCSSLTSCTIGNSVTSIGSYAFGYCSLTSINIPNTVTSIGESAFRRCYSLTSVDIPSGVTSIGNYTFYACTGLTSAVIPSGVTSIGGYAFNSCRSLTSITIKATTPPTLPDPYVFENTNNCPIYVPSGSVDTYKNTRLWNTYASRITAIPNS